MPMKKGYERNSIKKKLLGVKFPKAVSAKKAKIIRKGNKKLIKKVYRL